MAPLTDPQTRRIRRVLATAAAAAVVVLVPTACDYAIASDRIPQNSNGASGQHSGHGTVENASSSSSGSSSGATATGSAEPSTSEDPQEQQETAAPTSSSAAPTSAAEQGGEGKKDDEKPAAPANNGLDVLARDCSKSQLPPHDGFQKGDRCVDTAFGEVGSAAQNPTLLITESPDTIKAGEAFALTVSTQNLIRDRFLGAAAGGYYLESSVLEGGIQRGHFHTACREIGNGSAAPDPAPAPAFFLATQDNKGGEGVSDVKVEIPKLDKPGKYQCAVWAGDGSHRIPMMERANQIPAFDSVRITVE
ncbi:hypothetical protein [Pseudonocardia oroxyli]|uniref:Pecanex-like protein 1 n=1 Tax=Pseudonocardia oroxyli TaxID=366584 RepID=A0A1G7L7G0_PSEOR|nr:hypothetical protein [Pseudonocardia oroxyli]SDF45331.1 hypothetical protein SAMN05216377_1056 [Pseudonocardia oroxyli]